MLAVSKKRSLLRHSLHLHITLSSVARSKFHKPSYITYFKYYLIQLDLVDMKKYSKANDNTELSRMLFMQPIKSKVLYISY